MINCKSNFNENEMAIGSITKVERYGWSILDEPGEFRKIDKSKLKIDPSYQRGLVKEKAILRIAQNWSWVACGCISVADRKNDLFVIDGQQRVSAALKRADIRALPAMVYTSIDVKEEAIGFLRLNTERANIQFIQKLKAMTLSGDPIAHRIQEMAEDCGRELYRKTSGNSIACVATIYRNLKSFPSQTEKVWPLIIKISEGINIHERIVDALIYLEVNGSESILETKWEKKLIETGYAEILRSANESAAYYAKGGAKVWALGIMKTINKRMQKKFTLKNNIA